MDKIIFRKAKLHTRLLTQIGFTLVTNGNLRGFILGSIYRGNGKTVCVPGLNCYSCPGALGACPIGSLQGVQGSNKFRISYYVIGLLVLFGALLGRFVCGWLCPFGLIQDLLHKIPFFRKLRTLPGEKYLRYLRYAVLAVLVLILPMFLRDANGLSTPWFCKLVCPSGTLMAGIPLVLRNPMLAQAIGLRFWWKIGVLAAIVLLSLLLWRPFCRYLCPLGAIYGLFNPVAAVRHKVDAGKCVHCGACRRACKLDIPAYEKPNAPDCIRCGDCIRACPTDALTTTLHRAKKPAAASGTQATGEAN